MILRLTLLLSNRSQILRLRIINANQEPRNGKQHSVELQLNQAHN